MWYDSPMSTNEINQALSDAKTAVAHARDTRAYHRKRTKHGSPQRAADLKEAQAKVAAAMVPIRSFLGSAPYHPQTSNFQSLHTRARKASEALQAERRRLWKMVNNPRKKETV